MKAKIYNQTGQSKGEIDLPEQIFGLPWNADMVHQVISSLRTNMRKPVAHTKTRGDVRGGGKKPWQQKGTGRARHGSIRSPLWVGGGVTHGPRNEKNFARTVSKKMKAKALFTILSKKFKDGEVVFLDELALKAPKTKEALVTLNNLGQIDTLKGISKKPKNALLFAVDKKDGNLDRGFSNFGNVEVDESRNLSPLAAATYRYIVFVNPDASLKPLAEKMK